MLEDLFPGATIISEEALGMLISEITNLLSANKTNLQAAIARRDFLLMAETFDWLQVCDPWQKSLRSMLQMSTHPSFALLVAILKDCPDMAQSKGMVENFLSTLSAAVEQMWDKQEFVPIEKLIIAVKSGSFKQVILLYSSVHVRNLLILFSWYTSSPELKRNYVELLQLSLKSMTAWAGKLRPASSLKTGRTSEKGWPYWRA
jgi:hypothetical protein